MRNIALTIRYDGTHYSGWQVQQNANSICAEMNRALLRVTGADCEVKGCSRTDSGVHANAYVLSFKTQSGIRCDRLMLALNTYLPDDIAVFEARDVPLDFHARYSATGKEYVYRYYNARVRDPFLLTTTYRVVLPLDERCMNEAAQLLVGTYDFRSFCSEKNTQPDTTRTVTSCAVTRDGDLVRLTIAADGFLYNMVRIIAGTLQKVGEGKLDPADIPAILAARDRKRAGKTAPARGLFLQRVFYDE